MMRDERHIAKRYHAPYIEWMSNSKLNARENWKCYLENTIDGDLDG